VRKRSIDAKLYTKFLRDPAGAPTRRRAISAVSAAEILLQPRRRATMALFADRFLLDGREVVDLATGEIVRLAIDRDPPRHLLSSRFDTCDALASLCHPLLVPLVDYGLAGDSWFEVHAARPPLDAGGGSRVLALHLVRFLRARGIDLTASAAERHVRAAVDRPESARVRAVGWRLVPRGAIDAVRCALESGGPPGVTCVTVSGAVGAGLRSARYVLARAARMAGFVVTDSRIGSSAIHPRRRHYCVIDWLQDDASLPSLLAHAGTSGGARHVWLRFTREPVRETCAIPLTPLTVAEMRSMVYRDPEYGPDESEIQIAIQRSRGWPGALLARLARDPVHRAVVVHETAPHYRLPAPVARGERVSEGGGVRRLMRVMQAAQAVAAAGRHARAERLLRKCVGALAARGVSRAAATGCIALGDLLLRRGRTAAAREAYERARDLQSGDVDAQVILAIARTHVLAGRRAEAEAACRTALVHQDASVRRDAAAVLADAFRRADDWDRAAEIVGTYGAERTPLGLLVMARLQLRGRDLAAAAASARAVLTDDTPPDRVFEAHAILAQIHHAMGELDAATRAAAAALAAAKRSRDRALVLLALAVRVATAPATARDAARRRRLVAAAARLPAARADDLREILNRTEPFVVATPPQAETLEVMVGLTEAAADDEQAVAAVVRYVQEALGACSAAAWTADRLRQVAAEGRPWPGTALARVTVHAGRGSFAPGLIAEAAEAVRAGGTTIGCVAARWAAGRTPAQSRVREFLRCAAAALAPAIAGLNSPAPAIVRFDSPDGSLGSGPAAEQLRVLIARASGAPFPVLIEGESGSGKELVARAIHARGPRRSRRFCAVNCAALTEDLLEAELFGHARGAFTGATGERAGLFEEADQGTLFLDEVAELSPRAQAKLLRVLQEGEVRRVGENMPRRVDVRIVAATNRPLESEADAGRFRADLRFRLDVIRISVPPLRDRADEIPALAERIWREAAARVGTRATLGSELLLALARYSWPGNVRELQNVLAALAVQAPARGRVPISLLPARIAQTVVRSVIAFDEARLEFERRFVEAALARAAGRKGLAAAQLGVSRQGLNKMLKRLGLSGPA
jgi:transcriptional regulator with AAA-type ATPase domain/tetratricopeptide (TPR) repeat protein